MHPNAFFASASDTIRQNFAGEWPFQTGAVNIEGWVIDAAMLHQACKDTMHRCSLTALQGTLLICFVLSDLR